MKARITYLFMLIIFSAVATYAQNTFPATGNVGIGTLAPASPLQVIGISRFGSNANYTQVDANGNLKFYGTGVYKLANNKYAFQSLSNPGYGLFFNTTDTRYEFRDANARPIFQVDMNLGDGSFTGGVKLGNSASLVPGNMRWSGGDFEGYNGSTWLSLSGKNSWSINGNTGTNAATNFIGTKDLQPLVFKINNTKAGYIDFTKGLSLGYKAMLNTTGLGNVAFGTSALEKNTTGENNAAFGDSALYNNEVDSADVVFGSRNTAIGAKTMVSTTIGHTNTAVGFSSLYNITQGSDNTAVGAEALYSNIGGYRNTAVGYRAMYLNTEGLYNIAIGVEALYNNNDFGNIAIGYHTLFANTEGFGNTASGSNSLESNTTGYANTAYGEGSMTHNTTGYYNTGLGGIAGPNTGDLFNTTAVGFGAVTTASNQVRIGSSTVTSIGGYRSWTNISDGRVKKNIKANVPGLAFIKLLKPVTYNLDLDAADKIIAKQPVKDRSGKVTPLSSDEINARRVQEQILSSGFIAQDVEAAAKKINYDFEGVDVPKNDKDLYGLRYSEFVVPLVKAVQELSTENDALKAKNDELEARLKKIETLLSSNPAVTSTVTQSLQIDNMAARLEQNIPNPAGNSTIIKYAIPANAKQASISVTNVSGQTIKTFVVNKSAGQLTIATAQLAAGNYFYTLMVDGKKIDTKQMTISR